MAHSILIVDDDQAQLGLLEMILRRAEYRVLAAENGDQALAILTSQTPDVFLLDFMMPGMSGAELCRYIRQIEQFHYTPILFLSARSDAHSIEEGLSAGANDYLTKPILPADLLSHIRNVLLPVQK